MLYGSFHQLNRGGSYGSLSNMQFRKLHTRWILKGRQRNKCKSCGYRYTVRYRGASPAKKGQVPEPCLAGSGFRTVGRFFECSQVAVYNRIEAFGKTVGSLRSDSCPDVIGTDEMHTMSAQKKTLSDMGCRRSAWEKVRRLRVGRPRCRYGTPSKPKPSAVS